MHDGAVGGGKPGIGRTKFLDFAALDLVRVTTGPNRVREGIAVAEIGSSDMIDRIEAFAELVRDFKAGDPRSDTRNRIVDEIPSFPLLDGDEYSGSKAGQSGGAVDYITYHGDVVRTLREARQACAADDETVGRHRLIDLLVIKGGRLAEVYEIKTSLDRQCLYTAIGQLMTHSISGGELAKRILGSKPNQRLEGERFS